MAACLYSCCSRLFPGFCLFVGYVLLTCFQTFRAIIYVSAIIEVSCHYCQFILVDAFWLLINV